jgi:GTPase
MSMSQDVPAGGCVAGQGPASAPEPPAPVLPPLPDPVEPAVPAAVLVPALPDADELDDPADPADVGPPELSSPPQLPAASAVQKNIDPTIVAVRALIEFLPIAQRFKYRNHRTNGPSREPICCFRCRSRVKEPHGPPVTTTPKPGPEHRSGTAAIVGRPNVGKSTFLNAALGEPLAIVSPVPQTTRNRILGVVRRPAAEIALLDTPGIHKPQSRLGRALNRTARLASDEADVVVYMTALSPAAGGSSRAPLGGVHPGDRTLLADIGQDKPTVLVVNQIDRVRDKSTLLPLIDELSKLRTFAAIVPISALRGDGTDRVLDEVAGLLPIAEPKFDEDALTDRPTRFFAGEFVREQILRWAREEIPHAVAVEVTRFEEGPGLVRIDATIHVEREGQKRIVIGKGGQKLKEVGTAARSRIEAMLGKKAHLALWVRVTSDWTESDEALAELGYGRQE